jgi:hypothetical protein
MVMTRMNYFIATGVGETGVPREKSTIKPLFKLQSAGANKLFHLSRGKAWKC